MGREVEGVDWAALRHARGDASDMPGLFRALCSPVEGEAEWALVQLRERICHQGVAVGEATSFAVPVLVGMASSGRCVIRKDVLHLVERVADSSHALRRAVERGMFDYRENREELISWEVAVDTAFRRALPRLAGLADDDDPEIRRIVEKLMARYQG